jgi:hypothetical protein
MLQPLQARYALLKPQEILYGTDRGLVTSSKAFLSGDWKKSRLFIRYPQDLLIWVNGHPSQLWSVEHKGTVHDLPPYGWLALGPENFSQGSEAVKGKRYDWASTPDCVFLDGRGTWSECAGIAASGSVAVRRASKGQGLSIITVEGVDRLAIGKPNGQFSPQDVRTAIGAVAESKTIAVQAFDSRDKDLGRVGLRRLALGWELQLPRSVVRLEIGVANP